MYTFGYIVWDLTALRVLDNIITDTHMLTKTAAAAAVVVLEVLFV